MTKTVLVCDSKAIYRELISQFLKAKGYKVLNANNGKECLELAKKSKLDAIVIDAHVPDMEHDVLLEELNTQKPKTLLIVLSGHTEPSDSELTAEFKFAQFLPKPFRLSTLLVAISGKKGKKSGRVLVVDDEFYLREVISEVLSSKGYEIVLAKNGKECLEKGLHGNFEAIFLDIRMPELDGISALKQLKQHGVKTPVILMSGYSDIKDKNEAKSLGAIGFLSKPFHPKSALEMLKST